VIGGETGGRQRGGETPGRQMRAGVVNRPPGNESGCAAIQCRDWLNASEMSG